jgi:NAD(P)-dependent dehydrogenase (short-subunit alcohol dehydrogenase family)
MPGSAALELAMRVSLLPVSEQVMVITGASSGIGLVTAREAARTGAAVVLAARNEQDLAAAVAGIRHERGAGRFMLSPMSPTRTRSVRLPMLPSASSDVSIRG